LFVWFVLRLLESGANYDLLCHKYRFVCRMIRHFYWVNFVYFFFNLNIKLKQEIILYSNKLGLKKYSSIFSIGRKIFFKNKFATLRLPYHGGAVLLTF